MKSIAKMWAEQHGSKPIEDLLAIAIQTERDRCALAAKEYDAGLAAYFDEGQKVAYESGVLDASIGIMQEILDADWRTPPKHEV